MACYLQLNHQLQVGFNTLLATTHIALSEVPKKLTKKLIHSKLDLFKDFCITYTDKPTLKVAGLNPHAGEEGILAVSYTHLTLPTILLV